MRTIRVQEQDFDVGAEFAGLAGSCTGIGGIGCFLGIVRDAAQSRPISAMELEHYPAMTEPAIERIAAEAERRWSLVGCTIIHRFGRLAPGENIVLVLAAAAHRQAALEATAFLIDWLKTRAPFWKKEHYTDGEQSWVEAREEDDIAAAQWLAEGC
ncbi:MAG: molybdenum cofactor biosynthesis protein MoaE [Acetobacteraceae bacterium]|nr:molybdenum cofactor biosynthesis protein MoaE [Acetobacteraceae bacterium]